MKDLLQSKKFRVLLFSTALLILGQFITGLNEAIQNGFQSADIVAALAAVDWTIASGLLGGGYALGQGLADFGKNAKPQVVEFEAIMGQELEVPPA